MDWTKGKILGYTVDPEAKALYVRLSDKAYAFGEDLDHQRRIDFATIDAGRAGDHLH